MAELTPEQIRALIEYVTSQGGSMDPGASGFTQYGDGSTQPGPMMNPYMPVGVFPETNKDGTINLNDQLTVMSKYGGQMADPMMSGFAGGAGFAPGAFESEDTWETMKTPMRDNLRRFEASTGSWESVVAKALLLGDTPQQAAELAEGEIKGGRARGPRIEGEFGAAPTVDAMYREMVRWGDKYFSDLATEPDVSDPANVRTNPVTNVQEMRTGSDKTPQMKEFDRLGLPYPNQEYSMDWYRGTGGGGQQMADSEAMSGAYQRIIEELKGGRDQFGVYTDPEKRATQMRGMAMAQQGPGAQPVPQPEPNQNRLQSERVESQPFFGNMSQQMGAYSGETQNPATIGKQGVSLAEQAMKMTGAHGLAANAIRMAGPDGPPPDTRGRNSQYQHQQEKERFIQAGTPNRLTTQERQAAEARRSTPRAGAVKGKERVRNDETTAAMIRAIQGGANEDASRHSMRGQLSQLNRSGRTPYSDAQEARSMAIIRQLGL